MKKIVLGLLAGVALVFASCNKFESKVTKISDEFETYTTLAANGDTLTGLRKVGLDYAIVEPVKVSDFKSYDDAVLTCVDDSTGKYRVYSAIGVRLTEQPVDSLVKENDYYVGYYPGGKVFYFPNNESWKECTASFTTQDYLFLRITDDSWEVYTLKKKEFVMKKFREITVVKNALSPEKTEQMLIFYEYDGKYKVVDMTDDEVMILEPEQYKTFEKKFKNVTVMDGESRYAEVNGFVI